MYNRQQEELCPIHAQSGDPLYVATRPSMKWRGSSVLRDTAVEVSRRDMLDAHMIFSIYILESVHNWQYAHRACPLALPFWIHARR